MTLPVGRPKAPPKGFRQTRMMSLGGRGHFYNPAEAVARAIRESMDPSTAPGKCKTLSEMSPEERRRIEERLNAKIAS